ncbi:RNA polymerase II elongation factor ELL2 [Cynoglossus semilaevis]|uniref:RNA polymerase II elongation factor ELL2 n=1 Tax=Cynoglossus semilaevis TaxID=244447 RepID=UPI000D624DAC|nr:RNA polymerase II elongation factor ELL2 [Cynoglossus semilaevis]
MASLRQEQRYGLYCGRNDRNNHRHNSNNNSHNNNNNRTLFHVKLTDTALRALEAYQNLKGSLPTQPSICFKGNQGYVKIPAPTPQSQSGLRIFSFYLSSDSKDQPQASFDCIHQYVSSDGREQLDGQGVIQDKITVCATEDSYQVTRERVSQVEKDSWSRSAIEIKPGITHPSKTAAKQINFSFFLPPSQQKTEWCDFCVPQVARVNPKDNSYLLRDDFYKHVQRDWPGYSREERRCMGRLLARKLQPQINSQAKSLQPNTAAAKFSEETSPHHSAGKHPAVKRPVPFDSPESLAVKRQKLVDHTKSEVHRTPNHVTQNPSPGPQTQGLPVMDLLFTPPHRPVSEGREPELKVSSHHPPEGNAESPHQQQHVATNHHKKKKPKKHKDKERTKEDRDSEWLKKSPDLRQKSDKLNHADVTESLVSEEKPDYVLVYGPIMSLEQRRQYQVDFCAEYDEYKDLHSRIATITHMFVQLKSKIKTLSPGSPDYKIMEDQILEKYNKFRLKFPGYREEKKRCEYLHGKLSYIKQLIVDYDVSQAAS